MIYDWWLPKVLRAMLMPVLVFLFFVRWWWKKCDDEKKWDIRQKRSSFIIYQTTLYMQSCRLSRSSRNLWTQRTRLHICPSTKPITFYDYSFRGNCKVIDYILHHLILQVWISCLFTNRLWPLLTFRQLEAYRFLPLFVLRQLKGNRLYSSSIDSSCMIKLHIFKSLVNAVYFQAIARQLYESPTHASIKSLTMRTSCKMKGFYWSHDHGTKVDEISTIIPSKKIWGRMEIASVHVCFV